MCQQRRGASSISIWWPLWTENRAQLSMYLSYNDQLAIILFSRIWPIYLCIYGFPAVWIHFQKYWTLCCSPSSFFSRKPLITNDHVVNTVPRSMAFDDSNHILFTCIMKSMYYLTVLSNKQEIDIFMKNYPTRCHTPPPPPLNLC